MADIQAESVRDIPARSASRSDVSRRPAASASFGPGEKLILIEFNELCPPLLDRWMASGDLPNFRKFYEDSQVFVTEADEAAPNLEPWIQWYTVHTGLSFKQHGVFNLTDGPKAGHVDLWEILSDRGLSVANCGSMNSKGFSYPGSLFLPDPWCTTEGAYPEDMQIFHRVIANRVQEYSNADSALSGRDYAEFLKFMLGHGLRMKTCMTVLKQLASEMKSGGAQSWRRATLLDRLQFDIFRRSYRENKFDFATFFSNSTAHFQHAYWRFFEPELFNASSEQGASPYRDAVLFGYQQMDELLGEFMKFERMGATLMLASALSQQPYLKYEGSGGQHFYRPRNVGALLDALSIEPVEVLPVMTHQYVLHFADVAAKEKARATLIGARCENAEMFAVREAGDLGLFFGNTLKTLIPEGAHITVTVDGERRELDLYELFYRISETKSGYHHPDGVFWVKSGSHQVHQPKVSILDVFPTILGFFQAEVPPGDYLGASLLSRA